MSLLSAERDLYSDLWSSVPSYAENAPGLRALPMFLQSVGETRGTLLDAGTGSGQAALALKELKFDVTLCDVTNAGLVPEARSLPFFDACLWHDLSMIARAKGHPGRTTFDYTYCCDVLEHIPPQFTMLAIDQMLRVTKKGLFLSICLQPDTFGIWAGRPLHQTVQSFLWWRDAIRELGTVVDARDLMGDAVFFVEPK